MTVSVSLPLSQESAVACVLAAESFGVQPWEIAVHAFALRQSFDLRARGDRGGPK